MTNEDCASSCLKETNCKYSILNYGECSLYSHCTSRGNGMVPSLRQKIEEDMPDSSQNAICTKEACIAPNLETAHPNLETA